jgi:hypothetical protein
LGIVIVIRSIDAANAMAAGKKTMIAGMRIEAAMVRQS